MANHASHLNVIGNKIKSKNIKKESNNGSLIVDTAEDKIFESQQHVLDFVIHACDLSSPTR